LGEPNSFGSPYFGMLLLYLVPFLEGFNGIRGDYDINPDCLPLVVGLYI